MRVLIVNHYAYTVEDAAGTRHYSLARHLRRRGHDVSIIAASFYHKGQEQKRLAGGERYRWQDVGGVPYLWLRTPSYRGNGPARLWNMLVFAWRVWGETGRRGQPRPDVVVGSSPQLFSSYATMRLARRYKIPFVLEVRDIWPETLTLIGGVSTWHPVILLMKLVRRTLYRRADRIVGVLPGVRDQVMSQGLDGDRVVWIPNGVDLGLAPEPQPPDTRDVFRVIYAGAHMPANALDVLLDAAALLRDDPGIEFHLYGDGTQKPALRRRVEADSLEQVFFHEPVPKSQVHEVLATADAFVGLFYASPLYQWGVSANKIFDYLAAGRPTVLSLTAPYGFIEEAGAGMMPLSGDAQALAGCLRELAGLSQQERWQMGLRGRAYVRDHHDVDRLAERLEGVLEELVMTGLGSSTHR